MEEKLDKLKNLFSKKKDSKFKGQGHRLDQSGPPDEPKSTKKTSDHVPHDAPTDEQKQAGLAALARLASTSGGGTSSFAYQHGKMELDANMGASAAIMEKVPQLLAVVGVFYRCPFIGPEVLPKDEWKARIRSYLEEQLNEDQALTSCLMIHSLNKNREKVLECIEILITYLNNILTHPDEEKYKKIRKSNRNFSDKVSKIEGSLEFLTAAGFQLRTVETEQGTEDYLVYENEVDASYLELLIDSLNSAGPIRLELDRNAQVLSANQAATMLDLPNDFYRLTVEELKREQRQRTESLKASSQLRTKAMREKDEQKEFKKYVYSLIRVRFPDGLFLQGTFNVYEKFIEVRKFVSECLETQIAFDLVTALGKPLSENEDEASLLNLKLVPAVLLNIQFKPSEESTEKPLIKADLIANMQKI